MSGEINWGREIEAYHTDGRVVPMSLDPRGSDMRSAYTRTLTAPNDAESNEYWNEDGSDRVPGSGWRIRNVAQAPSQPRTAPSGGEVGPEVDKTRLKALEAFWKFVVDTQPYDDALDLILAKARALLHLGQGSRPASRAG